MKKEDVENLTAIRLAWAEAVIREQTQALKDIINAASGDPYDPDELQSFLTEYQNGYEYLEHFGIEEIA
jgi:hypothetical protein